MCSGQGFTPAAGLAMTNTFLMAGDKVAELPLRERLTMALTQVHSDAQPVAMDGSTYSCHIKVNIWRSWWDQRLPMVLYSFPMAAITNYINLVALTNIHFLFHSPRDQKSEISFTGLKSWCQQDSIASVSSGEESLSSSLPAFKGRLHCLAPGSSSLRPLLPPIPSHTDIPPPSSNDSCDYTGPTRIIQDTLPVLWTFI